MLPLLLEAPKNRLEVVLVRVYIFSLPVCFDEVAKVWIGSVRLDFVFGLLDPQVATRKRWCGTRLRRSRQWRHCHGCSF